MITYGNNVYNTLAWAKALTFGSFSSKLITITKKLFGRK